MQKGEGVTAALLASLAQWWGPCPTVLVPVVLHVSSPREHPEGVSCWRSWASPLGQDRPQDPEAVAQDPQVARPVDPLRLMTGNLDDPKTRTCGADVHARFDLEP